MSTITTCVYMYVTCNGTRICYVYHHITFIQYFFGELATFRQWELARMVMLVVVKQ